MLKWFKQLISRMSVNNRTNKIKELDARLRKYEALLEQQQKNIQQLTGTTKSLYKLIQQIIEIMSH